MRGVSLFLSLALVFLGVSAGAQFQVPRLTGPIIDEVGYLTRDDRQALMQLLYDFNRRGKAQVQVVIIPSLQGEAIESASIKITDAWKLGDAKKDNGVLFLVSAEDRKMRIEVGQGLEGAIPDAIAKRIISDQVIPLFRSKRFSDGIVLGTHEILRYADKEFADENIAPEESGGKIPVGVIVLLLIIISILGRFGGGGGRRFRGGGWGGGGYYGGGGWSGGGGSSGGGWSGGGGGFSGGGASGSW